MKLTTLEIKGFKSFADKTTLHFNENVTGVVGPNGCGKSNIVDAIRWVLGEQKPTAIRTERMENLIFNGTKARKASGMAEVSLTFENTRNLLATEFSTVTISRHYFKTGESEYRINGTPCRLKDITGLFMDTGISTDSYAIIELGMLDDILHNKDNSRRRLFEQAAGISKYKVRKRETLNKLTLTQQDLDRVEDILFEIENNLKELEKQAKKAHRYQRLKAEYKSNSIDLAILTLQSHKDIYKQLTNQQTYEADAKTAVETEINSLEAITADKKAALIEKEQSLSALQKELNALLDAIRLKENENNVNKERIKYLEEKEITLGESIKETDNIIEHTRTDISLLETHAAEEKEKMLAIQQSLKVHLQNLDTVKNEHADTRKLLDDEQNAFKQAEKELYETDKKIAISKVRLENYNRELGLLDADTIAQVEKLEPLKAESVSLDSEKEKAENILNGLLNNETQVKEKIQNAQKEIEHIKNELAEIHRKSDAKNNEYELTKNLYDSFEGFPESIKYLKKNVASMYNAPLVSDVINCDDAYKTAIESYLDAWLNYYIVQDMAHAVEAVEILAKEEKGRAHFFLLSAFTQNKKPVHLNIDGLISAMDVVAADEKYLPLIQNLLSHVMIVNADADFEKMAEQMFTGHPDIHLLHQSGKIIKSGKTVSGGSVGVYKGKRLGREQNLKLLGEDIAQIQAEEKIADALLIEKQEQLNALQKNIEEKEIQNAREAVNRAAQQIISVQTRIENSENLLKQMEEKKQSFHAMIHQTEEESVQLQTAHSRHFAQKENKQSSLLEMEVLFREANEKLNQHSELYNAENIRFHQQQNKYQSIAQELQYKSARLEEAEKLSASNKKYIEEVRDELTDIHKKLHETQQLLLSLYNTKVEKETTLTGAEENYFGSRGEIAETEEQIKTLQKKKELSDAVLSSIKDKLNDLKVQLAATKERLLVEFQVELESILDQEPPQDISLEQLQEKVDAAKKRLENYGDVNPMAIQAFEEMKQRYDFIKSQREDLLNAKTSLMLTIEEIDQTAKQKFDEAFIQVRQNFIEVFRSLFSSEDDCDLVLKDSFDPLEAEVEIIAKPKGKKPQVLDQLSGGEKTLTAMALLFGLYLLKPAPFCILDEVDAPLDDNNIMKFNTMIRTFSNNSQFIIVTHNKRTMAEVDVIYGVTMPEQGISKVVPVDFRGLN